MCVLYPQDQTQLTFHRVCRTQINHHLSRRPLPFTKFEQIFSHYILPLFWSHTKLIFLPLALFLYMLCSSVNHSYDSSSTLSNAKNFIPAFFFWLPQPLSCPLQLHELNEKNTKIIFASHFKSNSVRAECVWHIDWLWFSPVNTDEKQQEEKIQ